MRLFLLEWYVLLARVWSKLGQTRRTLGLFVRQHTSHSQGRTCFASHSYRFVSMTCSFFLRDTAMTTIFISSASSCTILAHTRKIRNTFTLFKSIPFESALKFYSQTENTKRAIIILQCMLISCGGNVGTTPAWALDYQWIKSAF